MSYKRRSKHRKHRKKKKRLGLTAGAIGILMIIGIIVPIWGWLLGVGSALIYFGWNLINTHK
ncbi:hypothetical protein [Clostridium oceanicum]|uniref:Secreted protein n=1 Tax=Clostridium oceanicum TaxID=1543 RepID=A0ABN1JBB0_9CLOT